MNQRYRVSNHEGDGRPRRQRIPVNITGIDRGYFSSRTMSRMQS